MAAQAGSSIKLIVGLGNPGEEYAKSRHNAGFMVIEKLLAGFPEGRFTESHSAESRIFSGKYRGKNLVLQMPLTYMNVSGCAVAPLSRRLGISPEEILVISDDLDLAPGRLRLRANGSDGGHNGLKSIISHLGSDVFDRIKIGVGAPQHADYDLADYVLGRFTKEEIEILTPTANRVVDAIETIITSGVSTAMNRYNGAAK